MKRLVIAAIVMLTAVSIHAQTAIGRWRDCLDYSRINHIVVAGSTVYGAARNGVAVYDTEDHTLTSMSKVSGLNDVGIATIAYDQQTGCLVVAYTNSNIDIIDRGRTYNLSDIKRTEISSNKEINAIRFHDKRAYLATGFGVVVVDLVRREIGETWFLGAGSTHTAIYDLAFSADSIYAATAEGLKSISLGEAHPSISDRWSTVPGYEGINITMLSHFDNALLCAGYTFDPLQLTVYRNGTPLLTGEVGSMHTGGGRLALTVDGRVIAYGPGMEELGTYSTFTWGNLDANDAVFAADGTLWVALMWAGMVGIGPDGSDETHQPSGPGSGDNSYRLRSFRNRMMLCPGGHTATFSNTYLAPNVFTNIGDKWQGIDLGNGALNGLFDIVDAAVNPRDTNETVAAMWGGGIATIRDNQVHQVYDNTNTGGALHPYIVDDYHSLRTSCVAFDRSGTLWVALSNTDHSIASRSRDGEWKAYSTEGLSSNLRVDKMVVDSVRGYIWFAGSDNAIFVHDGESRYARVNPNNGSKLQTENVNAIEQDQNGNIWVGTNKGIKVIYDGYNAFKNGGSGETAPVACNNITISNGDFSEYLMAYENITCIAVDGANRKWVGTASGGLYMLSANGMDQLEHFTSANSPLFSDKIVCLGIQPRSGDVYIGTDRGLQVYRGTATYADAAPQSEVYAYPNPVRPGYDGPIAIKGFTRNALVRITDAAGNTVYSTQANGGQAIWNGRTASGEPVASGVYYVFASDAEGGNRSVAKILIIR